MYATTITEYKKEAEYCPTIVVTPGMVFKYIKSYSSENEAIVKAEFWQRELHKIINEYMNSKGFLMVKRNG